MIAEAVTTVAVAVNIAQELKGFTWGMEASKKIKAGEDEQYGFAALEGDNNLGLTDALNLTAVACWGVRMFPDTARTVIENLPVAEKILAENPELWCVVVPAFAGAICGLAILSQVPELALLGPMVVSARLRDVARASAEELGKFVGDKYVK